LYIDIDGVLLGKKDPNDYEICIAGGARDFLAYALWHFDCYWLTSRANRGDARSALEALKPYADKVSMELAKVVKPTSWATLKTEAIDLKSDFYWLDDQLFQTEREVLEQHGRIDRWVKVDTRANYSDLVRVKQHLARLIQKI
jgi:hypothetical protein